MWMIKMMIVTVIKVILINKTMAIKNDWITNTIYDNE